VVLPLIYMTRLLQGVLFGPIGRCGKLDDLDAREFGLLLLLALIDIYLGIHPAPLLDLIHRPVALLTGVMP
jgi:NADH-quinone oxidoreductase subunit M